MVVYVCLCFLSEVELVHACSICVLPLMWIIVYCVVLLVDGYVVVWFVVLWFCVCVWWYGFSVLCCVVCFFFFKQKTAYEMRISDWSSDVCSSDLRRRERGRGLCRRRARAAALWLALDRLRPHHPSRHRRHPLWRRAAGGRLRSAAAREELARPARLAGGRRALRRFHGAVRQPRPPAGALRSEEHTSELQSLMRISYAVFCLKKKKKHTT